MTIFILVILMTIKKVMRNIQLLWKFKSNQNKSGSGFHNIYIVKTHLLKTNNRQV